MVELDKLFKTKVKHTGIFDFKETYRILYEWFVDNGYDLNEKTYKEVIGAGNAKEIEIEWDAVRKVSDYFRFEIKADWHIIGMTSVEVEIDGVKQKMNKGQFEIVFSAILQKDYEERWTGQPFIKFLRTLYDKYLIRERVEKYEQMIVEELNKIVEECKAYLSLTGRNK